jgi:hypothetical protein
VEFGVMQKRHVSLPEHYIMSFQPVGYPAGGERSKITSQPLLTGGFFFSKKMPRSDENHRSLCRVTVIVMASLSAETSRFVEARLAAAGRYPARLNSEGIRRKEAE